VGGVQGTSQSKKKKKKKKGKKQNQNQQTKEEVTGFRVRREEEEETNTQSQEGGGGGGEGGVIVSRPMDDMEVEVFQKEHSSLFSGPNEVREEEEVNDISQEGLRYIIIIKILSYCLILCVGCRWPMGEGVECGCCGMRHEVVGNCVRCGFIECQNDRPNTKNKKSKKKNKDPSSTSDTSSGGRRKCLYCGGDDLKGPRSIQDISSHLSDDLLKAYERKVFYYEFFFKIKTIFIMYIG